MDAATAERGPPRVNRWEGDFYRTAIGAYGRILASLIRMVWDITLAEDALADGKRDEIAYKDLPSTAAVPLWWRTGRGSGELPCRCLAPHLHNAVSTGRKLRP
jgi:hypothetical protein